MIVTRGLGKCINGKLIFVFRKKRINLFVDVTTTMRALRDCAERKESWVGSLCDVGNDIDIELIKSTTG